jgi:hypothetical protein
LKISLVIEISRLVWLLLSIREGLAFAFTERGRPRGFPGHFGR